MKTNANLNGQAPYSSQDIIIGASVTESLGIAYFWKAKTFEDILKITSYSTPLPKFGLFNKLKIGTFFSLGFGFGDGVVSVQGGLGFGIKFSSINMELVRSISITDKEANKLITGTFTSAVGLTTPQLMLDKEGNKTGFKAELLAVDKKRQI